MRYRLLIEYDGTPFHGWQIQPNCETVQETIERALETALRYRPNVVGSGRTDTGVHARGQVAHVDLEEPLDLYKLRRSLNGLLPVQIAILDVQQVTDDFHARFDAKKRTYMYHVSIEKHPLSSHRSYIIWREPDFGAMNRAAHFLLGMHDCSAFCRIQSETKNRMCNVKEAHWSKETYKGDWVFKISADRFLHGMVRTIVGTLLEVGYGKRNAEDMLQLIASQDRTLAGQLLHPMDWYLKKCYIPFKGHEYIVLWIFRRIRLIAKRWCGGCPRARLPSCLRSSFWPHATVLLWIPMCRK